MRTVAPTGKSDFVCFYNGRCFIKAASVVDCDDIDALEKEIIYIVTKTEQKNAIMSAIMKEAGLDSKAKAITFSLPVTDTAGLRLIED